MKHTAALTVLLFSLPTLAQDSDDVIDDDAYPMDQTVPVAEEEIPPDSDESVLDENEELTEEKLLSEFARYRLLVTEGTFDEADIAAKRIVEMAIKIYGPTTRETASALNNLGIVQHNNEQYDAAIQNFTSSVEIIESVEDRLNTALVNPLKGLGAAQMAIGRPDRANKTFVRAAHITHVNEGPHNIEQTEILESIAETQLRLGDTKAARSTLDRIHVLNARFFQEDPLGLIPSLMNRADWQHRSGYYNEERTSYRRAIRIIESGGDKNNPMLIEPLRRLGNSFYFIDVTGTTQQQTGFTSTGEMYFKRAVRIAESTDSEDWRDLVTTQLALADYYVYSNSHSRAKRMYRSIWKFLSTDEQRVAFRTEKFGNPVATREAHLPMFVGKSAGDGTKRSDLKTGKITVEYAVTTRGQVRNLTTTASPAEFTDIQRMVHREVRQRVYRPRIVDGEPVEAVGQIFEHSFSYTEADLEELKQPEASQSDVAEQEGDSQ